MLACMRRLLTLVLCASWSSAAFAQAPADASKAIDTYCATCHDGGTRSPSGPLLDRLDPATITDNADVWARAYRQLQAGAMPPGGAPRPDRATEDTMLLWIEQAFSARRNRNRVVADDPIATRLARMLWNSAPDEVLLREARRGRLIDPDALERQVRRMLADDRARALVGRFFFPWLQLDQLASAEPDEKYFPDFDLSLRDALAKETALFLLDQIRGDRDPLELWTADYTFLNEPLARHYGVPNVAGPQFRRFAWSRPERAGLLGHGSVHMVTSRHQHGVDAGYTTPALRAKWIRLHFLGAPLPNGFPGAQPVTPELPITPQTRTLPATPCVNCHRDFFPLGYALENFDPIGRWRTHDQLGPVDASGDFGDGTSIDGVIELRQRLLSRPDAFRTTLTEALLVYAATGAVSPAGGTPGTLMTARQILRGTSAARWSTLLAAVASATAAQLAGAD